MEERKQIVCPTETVEVDTLLKASVRHYDFNVALNVKEKSGTVQGQIRIDFMSDEYIDLVLWRNTGIYPVQH